MLSLSKHAFPQGVAVNANGNAADPSAIFDASSINKGFLIPRMTTVQRDAINSPAIGLLIFNTTTNCFEAYVNGAWNTVSCPAACTPPAAPVANAASSLSCSSFTANWSASAGATSYYLDVATDAGFTSFISGYNNLNVGNVQTQYIASLSPGTTYYYRVRAATACASINSNTITAITINNPAVAGTITGTATVCQGQNGIAYSVPAIADATSYTWSYSGTGFAIASGSGTNSIIANFSGSATSGNLSIYGSNSCGNGTASANYAIVVNAPPTTANAGSDINVTCGGTTATLAGNTPTSGTGSWSVVSGTASITTPNSSTSGVTGLAVPATTTLRWSISNAPCTASFDDVLLFTTNSVWHYRNKITIIGQNGAGTNYQVLLKIGNASGGDFNLNGHSASFPSGKNTGGDLLFMASDGITVLPFWVQRVDGSGGSAVASVWVKVRDNLDSNQDIYIYYGNSFSPPNGSNIDSTFVFGDDFFTKNTTKWSFLNGDVDLSNHYAYSFSAGGNKIQSNATIPAMSKLRLLSEMQIPGNYDAAIDVSYPASGTSFYSILSTYYGGSEPRLGYTDGSVSHNLSGTFNVWYFFETLKDNNSFKQTAVRRDNSATSTVTGTSASSYTGGEIIRFMAEDWQASPNRKWNFVAVGKYTSPEPAFGSAGAEEVNCP
ncbi:MAG: hypothetical protein A2X01_14795 [Bacteroidetes bacterium GWF2_35_48]|nr:MAG: hypothetical protein A2X01_14795 [Bacteroidetes bacterium GWF2_35_48]